MAELQAEVYEAISALCRRGDELADIEEYELALGKFRQAYELIPSPKESWEAATWVLGAIGDCCFQLGNYGEGRRSLSFAMHCPDAIGNPFLHLRLGQCQFELGNLERAADELARAYLLEGKALFAEDDEKYLAFVKSRLTEPVGGWPDGW